MFLDIFEPYLVFFFFKSEHRTVAERCAKGRCNRFPQNWSWFVASQRGRRLLVQHQKEWK